MTENSLLARRVRISTESRRYAGRRDTEGLEKRITLRNKVRDGFFSDADNALPLTEARRPTPLLSSASLNLFSFFWLTGDYGRALTQGVQARKMRC